MARGARFVFVLLIFALVVSSVESTVISSNCTESLLTSCEEQFNENTLPVCPEVLELQDCLSACANTKNKILNRPSQAVRLKYESLVNKMNSYPDCISASKVHKKQCSEENVNNCYQQFNQNATSICPEVKKLRMCISELAGCHAMKHPKFVLSIDILEKHRDCFFVNYSRILEVLKKKDDKKTDKPPQAFKTPKTGNTISVTSINITEKPPETRLELESGHLPYTFVVVATVCTCMFLVVLVVFSIVRHTTISKRQRNSTIERAPMRICIRSRNPTYRTRRHRHRHHRNNRGHVAMHGARQTVSGFFEGNVAPPPYSAVLDDNESVRAGDPPPPYRPPSCMAVGVIV
ncbi:uncharacterized protein LOC144631317 [Oculina patagonica]